MSLFSYISFPRGVDTSCLKSRVDKSKIFTVGELRKNKKLSKADEQLPDNVAIYLGDFNDLYELSVFDNKKAKFKNVFKNPFIYELEARFNIEINEPESGIDTTGMEDFIKKLDKDIAEHIVRCRQQLYDLVQFNTKPGEIVEIYADWADNRNIFKFGPPRETRIINSEQILESELLDTQEKLKIEICNNK